MTKKKLEIIVNCHCGNKAKISDKPKLLICKCGTSFTGGIENGNICIGEVSSDEKLTITSGKVDGRCKRVREIFFIKDVNTEDV